MGQLKSWTLKYPWWFGIFRQYIISKVTYHREQVSISSSQKSLQSIGTNFNSFTMILIFHGFLIIRSRIESEFLFQKVRFWYQSIENFFLIKMMYISMGLLSKITFSRRDPFLSWAHVPLNSDIFIFLFSDFFCFFACGIVVFAWYPVAELAFWGNFTRWISWTHFRIEFLNGNSRKIRKKWENEKN